MTDNADLGTLFPERELTVRRRGAEPETLTLSPIPFGRLPKTVALLRPMVAVLTDAQAMEIEGTSIKLASDWPLKLPQIVAEGGEALMDVLAYMTGKPRVWFDTLPMDDGIALTRALFEVNGDFFAQRIAPMLPVAVTSTEPSQADSDGAQSSLDLSSTATAETTSAA